MQRELLTSVFSAFVLAACAGKEKATRNSAKSIDTSASATPTKVGETSGFSTPESVRYDPELDVFYVSNITGNPSQKDGKGSISAVRADSTGIVRILVESGKNGATLNAPKGLALIGDTLWVADIDAVRGFNRRTGAPVATIDLRAQKATF